MTDAPDVAANVPMAQETHIDWPVSACAVPGIHGAHDVAFTVDDERPTAQGVHEPPPEARKEPTPHVAMLALPLHVVCPNRPLVEVPGWQSKQTVAPAEA